MRILLDSTKCLVLEATPDERIALLNKTKEYIEYFNEHDVDRMRGMVRANLALAWEELPYSGVLFSQLMGKRREVLFRAGLRSSDPHQYGTSRLSGSLDPAHIDVLITVLQAAKASQPVRRSTLDEVFGPGSATTPNLAMRLLGTTKALLKSAYYDTKGEHVDTDGLLSGPDRSGDEGRTEASQGPGEADKPNPASDRRGASTSVPEPADSGPVREPARAAHTQPRADQDQVQQPDHADQSTGDVLTAEEPSATESLPSYGEIKRVDESGDSFVQDLLNQEGGVDMAGWEEWEQDFDD